MRLSKILGTFLTLAAVFLLSACKTGSNTTTRKQIVEISRQRILIDDKITSDQQAELFIAPYKAKLDSMLSPVVGTSARYMDRGWPEGLLSNLLPDILLWESERIGYKADFGMYNIGGIRASLPEGTITKENIIDIEPFDNRICVVTIKGKYILPIMMDIYHRYGAGFSHGIELVYDIKADGVRSLRLNGQDILSEQDYRIATIEYLAEGNDRFDQLLNASEKYVPSGDAAFIYNILVSYFMSKASKGEAVDSKIEGRVQFTNQ